MTDVGERLCDALDERFVVFDSPETLGCSLNSIQRQFNPTPRRS
jgi:hypothetical protein